MHFYDRGGNGSDGVCNGHRGMGVTAGIQNNEIITESTFLKLIDDFSLNIALVAFQFH